MGDGQIVFEITADGKKAIADIKDVTDAIKQETKKWDASVDDASDNMQQSMQKALDVNRVKDWALKIGAELVKIGQESINLASDLQEVQNVVDVTFGTSSAVIDAWASNAGKQYGLTETQAKRFTSTIGAMAKSAGMSGDSIVEMSTDLAGLAADMASFYNLDFDTAFQKIRSGISGETEPLKQLGINMSVANLEAYALSQGISKAFNQMSQGEQTMLRYQYLMSATADAQGDFARTSDSYANSVRQLQTNLDALKTKMGEVLIGGTTEVINSLNKLFEKIAPTESETVFDQIANVQLNTQTKLEEIETTASRARTLVSELQKVEGTNLSPAASKINSALNSIGVDKSKKEILEQFIAVVTQNVESVGALSGDIAALNGATGEGAGNVTEWLSQVSESAKLLTEDDVKGWSQLASTLSEGLPGLSETDGGQSVLKALGAEVEKEADAVSEYLKALGIDSSAVADKQAYWLALCRELVKTIPGLSSIINTQTGEIKGGTQALTQYIDEWQKAEEKAALLEELAQERKILNDRYSDRYKLRVDTVQAEAEMNRLQKKVDEFDQSVKDSALNKWNRSKGQINWFGDGMTEEERAYIKVHNELVEARTAHANAVKAETDYNESYNASLEIVQNREQAVIEKYGELEAAQDGAASSASNWSEETKTAIQQALPVAESSVTALADYVDGVRTSVDSAVSSVISGFNRVTMPSAKIRDQISKLNEDLQQLGKRTEKNKDQYDSLTNQIAELNAQLNTDPKNLQKALEGQATFMQDYLNNLKQAQAMGLSKELLATLSDGSVESAEYLKALVSDSTGNTAREIDKQFQEVQKLKSEFTGALTDQQLAADQMFADLSQQAAAAVASLDQGQAAAENAGKTIAGIASGINANISGVSSAVDGVLAQLNRLNGWGINFNFGPLGDFGFSLGSIPQLAVGMDFVPHDGFLASLHEGEGVLTAEENRIWQRFKTGGVSSRNVDYDTLGGVMRDNVKAGGDVYLDGRVVGGVISDMQARSYKALKRSGWQA